jgi:hypothetical protein
MKIVDVIVDVICLLDNPVRIKSSFDLFAALIETYSHRLDRQSR